MVPCAEHKDPPRLLQLPWHHSLADARPAKCEYLHYEARLGVCSQPCLSAEQARREEIECACFPVQRRVACVYVPMKEAEPQREEGAASQELVPFHDL
jgi:hypothetical protein